MESTLNWEDANSDTVERFAYIPEYKDLLIRFRKGGEYVYHDVPASIPQKLRGRAHVWSKIRDEITAFPYEKLGSIRTEPLKGRGNNKTQYGKAIEETAKAVKPRASRARSTKAAAK